MNLKNHPQVERLDKSEMLFSIESFPNQCQQAWEEARNVKIPPKYREVENIVVSGMGGSTLGTHIIQTLYGKSGLKIPLQIINDYHLPAYAGEETLVVLSSYSGGTEETLSCAQDALQAKSQILGITTGGKLAEFLRRNNLPGYIFQPKFNPCGQPRISLGYSLFGQLALLTQVGVLNIEEKEIPQIIRNLSEKNQGLSIKAKKMAASLRNKVMIIVAGEFLAGNAHVFANQINENAKTMSFYFILPEMDHHLLEGLKNPNLSEMAFLFIKSSLYTPKIMRRLRLTKEVIEKNGMKTYEFHPAGKTPLFEVLETLWFGSFLSFYLALDYGFDPSPIPWVDYFKKQLEGSDG